MSERAGTGTGGYFTRSRTGCGTCRRSHVKCDERKPSCSVCTGRGVPCDGYSRNIRWIGGHKRSKSSKSEYSTFVFHPNSATDPLRVTSSKLLSCGLEDSVASRIPETQCQNKLIVRQKCPANTQKAFTIPPLVTLLPETTSLDRYLFDHAVAVIGELVYVNSEHALRKASDQMFLALQPNSLVFHQVITSGAFHLFQHGVISQQIAFTKKALLVRGVRSAVDSFTTAFTRSGGNHLSSQSTPSCSIDDALISASMGLIGVEIILGSPLEQIIPLLEGNAALLKEFLRRAQARQNFVVSSNDKDPHSILSPLMYDSMRMLAYFDMLSCVPLPRKPVLDPDIWLTGNENGSIEFGDDPMMGCFAKVLALTGECSRLIHSFFEAEIDEVEFEKRQSILRTMLDTWSPEMNDSHIKNASNLESLRTGYAHKMASLIFLLRSNNETTCSEEISNLVALLKEYIFSIPIESPFTATMLWPVFALGCESITREDREEILLWISRISLKQKFGNVQVASHALQHRIWGYEESSSLFKTTLSKFCRQREDWVKICWEEKIGLMLA